MIRRSHIAIVSKCPVLTPAGQQCPCVHHSSATGWHQTRSQSLLLTCLFSEDQWSTLHWKTHLGGYAQMGFESVYSRNITSNMWDEITNTHRFSPQALVLDLIKDDRTNEHWWNISLPNTQMGEKQTHISKPRSKKSTEREHFIILCEFLFNQTPSPLSIFLFHLFPRVRLTYKAFCQLFWSTVAIPWDTNRSNGLTWNGWKLWLFKFQLNLLDLLPRIPVAVKGLIIGSPKAKM